MLEKVWQELIAKYEKYLMKFLESKQRLNDRELKLRN